MDFGDNNKELWPPRSPDLNPRDVYLGHIKNKEYSNNNNNNNNNNNSTRTTYDRKRQKCIQFQPNFKTSSEL